MDSFEFNKIAGAVLGTLLFTMALSLASEAVFYQPPPKKPGYDLPAASEAAPGAGSPEAKAPPAQPLPVLLASADPKKGEMYAKACAVCHNFEKGAGIKLGPALYGVVGRPKASFPGFDYSNGMKAKGGNWTFADINTFITNPPAFVENTKMKFPGEKDPKKRADIIAYLDSLSDNPVPLPKP